MDLAPPEHLGLNMTPMIDIVFNLVQFFMLTLDLSHKEVAILDLPRAHEGVEERAAGAPDASAPPRVIVHLEQDGKLAFKGHSWPLSVAEAADQAAALEHLRLALRTLVARVPREAATGASLATVLIRGDRQAKWKYVQWILQVCADPSIRIHRLQFAVDHLRPGREGGVR